MITEQELELALELRDQIKDLKVTIAKIEGVVLSETNNLSSGVNIDNVKIKYDEYTRDVLALFKEDVLKVYRMKLDDLIFKYNSIIESPEMALRRIIAENDN